MSIEPLALGAIQPEATLEDCEQALHAVERNAAIAQGMILRHIRDHELYKEKHPNFADYVERHLGYTAAWASQRINLADTAQQLTMVNSPAITNERQARAIKPVLRDHGPEVAAEVLRAAADDAGTLTARAIEDAKQRHPATRATPVEDDEPVEVLTVEEWKAREGVQMSTDPDPGDFIPAQTKFELAVGGRLAALRRRFA